MYLIYIIGGFALFVLMLALLFSAHYHPNLRMRNLYVIAFIVNILVWLMVFKDLSSDEEIALYYLLGTAIGLILSGGAYAYLKIKDSGMFYWK